MFCVIKVFGPPDRDTPQAEGILTGSIKGVTTGFYIVSQSPNQYVMWAKKGNEK